MSSMARAHMLTVLLIGMLTLAFNIQSVEASGTIYIRADGSVDPPDAPIKRDGDLYIFTDNIYDKIVVERSNIVVDGSGFMLQGSGGGNGFFLSGVSNVTIKRINIKGFNYGVRLNKASYSTVSMNNITNNLEYGIRLDYSLNNTISLNNIATNIWYGIHLSRSSNNTISLNNITAQNWLGIDICRSPNNIIRLNNVTYNGFGIALDCSPKNILRNNIMANNKYNFGVVEEGLELPLAFNDVDVSNTVDGKPIYYWINKCETAVPLNAGYVALVNCTNIKVKNLNLKSNLHGTILLNTNNTQISLNNITANLRYGILFMHSSNNTISLNNIANSERGISLLESSNNTVSLNNVAKHWVNGINLAYSSNNTISLNTVTNTHHGYGVTLSKASDNTISANNIIRSYKYGMYLGRSFDNVIFHNNFINNTKQVYSYRSVNTWDDGYPSGGNYWSDYEESYPGAKELDDSGIWDTPYVIDESNQDNYPLMEPWTPLPRTIGELKTKVEGLGSKGQIDNQGIVKSLIAKLNVAQKLVDKGKIDETKIVLEDLILQVQELSGIHITPEATGILIKSAEHIISHL